MNAGRRAGRDVPFGWARRVAGVHTGAVSFLDLSSLSPRLRVPRRNALTVCAALAVLSLPGAQPLSPVLRSQSMETGSAAEPLEGQSYYYDALWSGSVVTAPAVESAPVAADAPTPYGVSSSAALTASGIPASAYRAYVNAAADLSQTDPSCGIPWSLIAGIGRVESNHGRHAGAAIGPDGVVSPPIVGVRLDGSRRGMARISDSDGGRYDGDTQFDRAVGPMQFLPGTWKMFGDGKNPQDMNAAALATARYLCHGNGNVSTQQGRWAAVFRYNHADSYVALVLSIADSYASGTVAAFPTRPAGTPELPDNAPSATPAGTPPAVPPPSPTPSGPGKPVLVTPPPGAGKGPTISKPTWTTAPPEAPVTTAPAPSPSVLVTTPAATTPPVDAPTTPPATPVPSVSPEPSAPADPPATVGATRPDAAATGT
jgi:hypothetical protein